MALNSPALLIDGLLKRSSCSELGMYKPTAPSIRHVADVDIIALRDRFLAARRDDGESDLICDCRVRSGCHERCGYTILEGKPLNFRGLSSSIR